MLTEIRSILNVCGQQELIVQSGEEISSGPLSPDHSPSQSPEVIDNSVYGGREAGSDSPVGSAWVSYLPPFLSKHTHFPPALTTGPRAVSLT